MDERMCRPGYRWNDTLKRCLAAGGGAGEPAPPEESIVPTPEPVGENPGAPAKPAKGKGGRGDVRINANGIMQTGTGMGKSIPVK